jgi:hypothetical protein
MILIILRVQKIGYKNVTLITFKHFSISSQRLVIDFVYLNYTHQNRLSNLCQKTIYLTMHPNAAFDYENNIDIVQNQP